MSHIYKRLITDVSQNTWNIKEKWELELTIIMEDNRCASCHEGITSQL